MTARWVVDAVVPNRDVAVTWQPISLYFKNEPEKGSDYYEPVLKTHKMLRVMEATRAEMGDGALQELYFEYARRIHHDKDRDFDIADALTSIGYDPALAAAAEDEAWDVEIRTRMNAGLELTGQDVGTPIIAIDDKHGVKQAYFGPVITRVPPLEESLAMWDALVAMMNVQGFWELKRTRTESPEFGERP